MEDDKRLGKDNEVTDIILPYSKTKFGVPGNLYIIGTMNTADRSVEALDTALRRRFVFEEMRSDPEVISPFHLLQRLWSKHWLSEPGTKLWEDWEVDEQMFAELSGMEYETAKYKALSQKYEKEGKQAEWIAADPKQLFEGIVNFEKGVDLSELLKTINRRLYILLSKDYTIGHAWLMNIFSLSDLQAAFKNKILPLLQEFFYNDYAKIGLVLGKNFVESKVIGSKIFADFDDAADLASEYADKVIYQLKDPSELSITDFISIYS